MPPLVKLRSLQNSEKLSVKGIGFKRMGSKERLTYPCHQGKGLRRGGLIPRESTALIVIWGDIECP